MKHCWRTDRFGCTASQMSPVDKVGHTAHQYALHGIEKEQQSRHGRTTLVLVIAVAVYALVSRIWHDINFMIKATCKKL